MHFVTFHIDGRKRTYRAEVFARTATDATLGVHHHVLVLVRTIFVYYNLNSASRTSIHTLATIHALAMHNTILLNPYGMTDLNRTLFFFCNGLDGSSRTDFRASGTFRTTITSFV